MLDVHQFDGQLGNAVYLNVYWKIKKEPEEIDNADIKNTVIHLPVTGDDYNALVEAQSKTLKRLSFEIVDAINRKSK